VVDATKEEEVKD